MPELKNLAGTPRGRGESCRQSAAPEVSDAHPGIDFQDNICGGSPRVPVCLLEALRRGGKSDAEDLANAWNYARTHREEMDREIAANGDDS